MSYNSDWRRYRSQRIFDFIIDTFKTASCLVIVVAMLLFALYRAGLIHEIFPR